MGGGPTHILSSSPRSQSPCWAPPLGFSPVVDRPWVLAQGQAWIWVLTGGIVVTITDVWIPPSKKPTHMVATGSSNLEWHPLQICSLHITLGDRHP